MKSNRLIIGIATTLAVGVLSYLVIKKTQTQKQQRLVRVADEGYETAYDVLYPSRR